MIEEKVSERIIDNIGKYLGIQGVYVDGSIYAQLNKTIDVRILNTITRHYNVRSFFNVPKTMNKKFELVVF